MGRGRYRRCRPHRGMLHGLFGPCRLRSFEDGRHGVILGRAVSSGRALFHFGPHRCDQRRPGIPAVCVALLPARNVQGERDGVTGLLHTGPGRDAILRVRAGIVRL